MSFPPPHVQTARAADNAGLVGPGLVAVITPRASAVLSPADPVVAMVVRAHCHRDRVANRDVPPPQPAA